MVFHMQLSKNPSVRIYIRPLRDYREQAQRRDVGKYEDGTFYVEKSRAGKRVADVRAAWISSLRPGDLAVVPKLWVLPRSQSDGKLRPSVDFAAVVAEVLGRGAVLIEGATGVASNDTKRWRQLLQQSAGRIAAGRGHSPRKATEYGRRGGKVMRDRSITLAWLSENMKKEREAAARIWRDPTYRNAVEAFTNLPEEITSLSMARRIFGKRMPHVKTGRPPMRKST